MTKSCTKCRKRIKSNWNVCPYCGRSIVHNISGEEQNQVKKKIRHPYSLLYPIENRNFELLVLLMLKMNQTLTWSDFLNDPPKINQATLSKCLSNLISHGFVYKVRKGNYSITREGKKRLKTLIWDTAQGDENIELYLEDGVHPSEAPVLALLEILTECEILGYEINDEGRIIYLPIYGSDGSYNDFFPEQICELKFLQVLYFQKQNIRTIPKSIKNLTYLKRLDLSYNNLKNFPNTIQELTNLTYLDLSHNKIQEFPTFVKEFTHLNHLYLADQESNVPYRNVFDCLDITDLKENLSLKVLSESFAKLEKKEQTEREELSRKFNEQKEPLTIIYPSQEILSKFLNKSQKFEYIILWMLFNNDYCLWSDFKSDPVNIRQTTLSKYLVLLIENHYIYKASKGYYSILESGKRRLSKIESSIKK